MKSEKLTRNVLRRSNRKKVKLTEIMQQLKVIRQMHAKIYTMKK